MELLDQRRIDRVNNKDCDPLRIVEIIANQ